LCPAYALNQPLKNFATEPKYDHLSGFEIGGGGFVINGVSPSDYSGGSVSRAGDVNGDGYDDLIVGAFGVSNGSGAS
jgi:hypothetical protein